jgi:hypothetical protein
MPRDVRNDGPINSCSFVGRTRSGIRAVVDGETPGAFTVGPAGKSGGGGADAATLSTAAGTGPSSCVGCEALGDLGLASSGLAHSGT